MYLLRNRVPASPQAMLLQQPQLFSRLPQQHEQQQQQQKQQQQQQQRQQQQQ